MKKIFKLWIIGVYRRNQLITKQTNKQSYENSTIFSAESMLFLRRQ